jgi:hypothetical protein
MYNQPNSFDKIPEEGPMTPGSRNHQPDMRAYQSQQQIGEDMSPIVGRIQPYEEHDVN